MLSGLTEVGGRGGRRMQSCGAAWVGAEAGSSLYARAAPWKQAGAKTDTGSRCARTSGTASTWLGHGNPVTVHDWQT
jgi:hypothetical protein